jgi:DNA (cytosine-5)-methyltransferase 1
VREALPYITDVIHDTGGFVQNKYVTDEPCPSVTVGINSLNSSHYLVRYDDEPCGTVMIASSGNDLRVPSRLGRRKFTIAELKRICAFPDDFVLTGSYAQQWERLGNSVPPVMMYHIAKTIHDEILAKL